MNMSTSFSPHLDILPASQRRLWDEPANVPPEFVLYGGTAIALHLAHRRSVDFDFSGDRPFDPERLATTIPFLVRATVTHQERNILTVRLRHGQIDLATALAAAQAIYGARFNPEITLKALAYFGEATLRRLPRAVKDRLAKAAGAVDLDRLPTIAVLGRARG
jgi:hypothetical protein